MLIYIYQIFLATVDGDRITTLGSGETITINRGMREDHAKYTCTVTTDGGTVTSDEQELQVYCECTFSTNFLKGFQG